jgi:predicted Fe-Mo cluster-binding NifX family protein
MSIKIAAVTDDGQTISQHFGRAKYYAVLTIENGQIIAREQREKMAHSHSSTEHHHGEHADPRGHGFAPAEQDRHFRMAEAIRDCQILLARGMGAGAYYSMEQVGIKPVITTIASIDEAALQAAAGTIVDHKEKLH